jgi:hypothetical protein
MDKLKEIVELGYAYGQAKAAAEYSEGVISSDSDKEAKTAAAISILACRRSMDKTADAFKQIKNA